nr:VanW family protein [uncultured Bacillus sp.]
MKLSWVLGVLLLVQQPPPASEQMPNHLTIHNNRQPIMTLERSDLAIPLPGFSMIDEHKLQIAVDQLNKQIRREPQDAFINEYGQLVPEQAGIEVNDSLFTEQLYTFFFQEGPASIQAPLRTVYPRVDSELLSEIRTKLIGHYVTYFNSRNKERSNNILLASQKINNHVVFPGETFSFNQTVGERTKAKGYLPAKIIVKGEYSEGIGGGICQVSSTLFNAADRAGLHIVKRHSHSRRVPYVPPGRDATVSWYGPDFSFKNEYNQPVLIRAKSGNGMMVVLFYSSDSINYIPKQIPRAGFDRSQHIEEIETLLP